MNHEKIYKILRWFLCLGWLIKQLLEGKHTPRYNLNVFIFSEFYFPGRLNSPLRAFLMNSAEWEDASPLPEYTIPIACGAVLMLLASITVAVKTGARGGSRAPGGKFRNPLRNLNVILFMLTFVFLVLQQLLPDSILPGLLFPRFPLGLAQTSIMAFFILWNPEARNFARKRLAALAEDLTGVTLVGQDKEAPVKSTSVKFTTVGGVEDGVAGAEAVGWSGEEIFVPVESVGGLEIEVARVGEDGGTAEDLVVEDLEMT